jgi:hypothetical protein
MLLPDSSFLHSLYFDHFATHLDNHVDDTFTSTTVSSLSFILLNKCEVCDAMDGDKSATAHLRRSKARQDIENACQGRHEAQQEVSGLSQYHSIYCEVQEVYRARFILALSPGRVSVHQLL